MGWQSMLRGAARACVAVLVGLAPFVPGSTASAAPSTIPTGYRITVSGSSPTMVWGEPSPTFRASLTVPAGDPGPSVALSNFYLLVDSQHYLGSVSGSGPTYSLYVAGLSPSPSVGQHSVFAQYAPTTGGLVTSVPVTLTVVKRTPLLECAIANWAQTYLPGTPLTITTSFANVNTPVDWPDGTFAVTFSGKQTFTDGGLTANGSGQVVAAAPSAPDSYQATCSFSGTSTVNPVAARLTTPTVIVTANHPIGGIRLRTDPATVVSGVAVTWSVVVLGGPGLPAPTGDVGVTIDGYISSPVALTDGGSVTFQATIPSLGPPSVLGANPIRVWYRGDLEYAASGADFPLTNGASLTTGPSSAPSNSATPPPAAAAVPADGPGQEHATPSGSATAALPSGRSLSTSKPAVWTHLTAYVSGGRYWIAPLVLVALIGLGGVLAWLRRRRSARTPNPTEG